MQSRCYTFKGWLLYLLIVLISGCSTSPTECDPRSSGFIGGAVGIMSGCYDQRVATKKQEYSAGQSLTGQLHDERQQLQVEKQRTSVELSEAKQRYAALQRDNARLQANLRHLQAKTSAQQREKARIQGELKGLQNQTAKGKADEQKLRKEKERLEQEVDQLASDIAAATVQ